MNRCRALFSFVLIAGFFVPAAHAAKTYSVAADGSGDFKTIEDAHEEGKSGDTIFIRGKPSATESVWNFEAQGGISYVGQDREEISVSFDYAGKISISRFIIRSLKGNLGSDVKVEDCLIEAKDVKKPFKLDGITFEKSGSQSAAAAFNGAVKAANYQHLVDISYGDNLTIRRSRISGASGFGLSASGICGITVEDCVITNNWGGGLRISGAGHSKKCEARIARNTIAYNQFAQPGYDGKRWVAEVDRRINQDSPFDIAMGAESALQQYIMGSGLAPCGGKKDSFVIEDNIIAYNDTGLLYAGNNDASSAMCLVPEKKKVVLNRNLFFGNRKINWGSAHAPEAVVPGINASQLVIAEFSLAGLTTQGNIVIDPQFKEPAKGDFRLSPALRAGPMGGRLGAPDEVAAPANQPGPARAETGEVSK